MNIQCLVRWIESSSTEVTKKQYPNLLHSTNCHTKLSALKIKKKILRYRTEQYMTPIVYLKKQLFGVEKKVCSACYNYFYLNLILNL